MSDTDIYSSPLNPKVEAFIKIALKYYDLTISILVVFVLLLDSFMINTFQQSFVLIIGLLIVICLISVFFDIEIISSTLQLNKIFNPASKLTVSNFIKSLLYIITMVEIITVPPEVPISFIIPASILPLASIDFYFILTALLITGLYFSIFNVLKMIFSKERQRIQQ